MYTNWKNMKLILKIICIISIMASSIHAQICEGNLGDNIFESGDFGSGADNVVQIDPNLAPGYIYTTQMPPNDGFYTISNNIDEWPNAFGWIRIEDNSPDPDGYMMIINASYDPGLFYTQEVNNLCDNTLYEFSADIFNLVPQGTNIILPNVSFLIDGVVQYSTGDIPENNSWNNYGFSFYTLPGQTDITLSLQNNAPGGQGNDIALDNISFRACGDEALILPLEMENICEDGVPFTLSSTVLGSIYDTPAYQWQQSFDMGQTWEDIIGANDSEFIHTDIGSEFYYYRFYLANGSANLLNPNCRVASNVKILQNVPSYFTFSDTICEGLTYNFNEIDLNQNGVYDATLLSSFGCDSIVTLNLEVVPDPEITADFIVDHPLCAEDEYGNIAIQDIQNTSGAYLITMNDDFLSEPIIPDLSSGIYTFIISDEYGCAFDTMIQLLVPDPIEHEITDTICEGLSYTFNSTELSMSGIYSENLVNNNGCDSLVNLNLVVVPDPQIIGDFIVEQPACAEEAFGSIAIENIQNTAAPFEIAVNNDIITVPSISDIPSGDYSFFITDRFGCAFDTTINISNPIPLIVDIGDDLEITSGESIVVSPNTNNNIVNYFWEPSQLFDCNTQCSILNWEPLASTLISLTVQDEFGCFASDSIWVRLEEKAVDVFIPNIFSPNNDGNNDIFFIQSNDDELVIRSCLIFDRWGNPVFKRLNFYANDSSFGWDGRFDGRILSSGVYVFIIEYENGTGQGLLKGDLTLLR